MSETKYVLFGNAQDTPNIKISTGISLEPNPFRLFVIHLTGNLDQLDINWEKEINAKKVEIGLWLTMNTVNHGKS